MILVFIFILIIIINIFVNKKYIETFVLERGIITNRKIVKRKKGKTITDNILNNKISDSVRKVIKLFFIYIEPFII